MVAVIRTGGKQYVVRQDDLIEVEKLEGKVGDKVTIKGGVLLEDGKMGDAVSDKSFIAEIVSHHKGDKVMIFKKKRRHNYRRKKGHRQNLTTVKILDIK